MSSLSIGARISLLATLLLGILSGQGLFAVSRVAAISQDLDEVEKVRWARAEMAMKGVALAAAQGEQVAHLLAGAQGSELQEVVSHMDEIQREAAAVAARGQDDESHARDLLEDLKARRRPYAEEVGRVRELALSGKLDEARAVARNDLLPHFSRVRDSWQGLAQYEAGRAVQDTVQAMKDIAERISIIEEIA